MWDKIIAVLVVNLVIAGVLFFANRFLPELKNRHSIGLYLILMPLGFGLYGWDLPYWGTAPLVFGGVGALLFLFRRVLDEGLEVAE